MKIKLKNVEKTKGKENMKLYELIDNITPAELAKIRNKRQETSTRDKERLLKKVAEIEEVIQMLKFEISFKKSK